MDFLRPGDLLVVTELSRMTRSLMHLLQLVQEFETKGINMVSLRENIDTSTATGRAFLSNIGAINQMERKLKAERTAAGREAAKARGKTGGRPKSEDRFRQLFEQNEQAIVLISPQDNSILDINPAAEHIFRKQKAELLEGGLPAICDPESYENLLSTLNKINKNISPCRIENVRYLLQSGETLILSFQGKKISLQGTEVIYTSFHDITTRVRLEEQAQEIQARLIQANRMTSLGTMVSSIAHEINNPNNFLLMNAEMIKSVWNDLVPVIEERFQKGGDFAVGQTTWNEVRTFLPDAFEGLQQGALRICKIVGYLKEYGRDTSFNRESVADANAVVRLSVSILSHHISKLTHKFRLEQTEALPLVKGSSMQLEQVVINLIQNALQALPDADHGIQVSTGLDPESGDVLIRVVDEGTGMPPEIAARIMEPFYSTRLEKGCTGLGLAISSSIIKEHGGSIEFSSEPGKGSTFTVRLVKAETPETNSGLTDCETKNEFSKNEARTDR